MSTYDQSESPFAVNPEVVIFWNDGFNERVTYASKVETVQHGRNEWYLVCYFRAENGQTVRMYSDDIPVGAVEKIVARKQR